MTKDERRMTNVVLARFVFGPSSFVSSLKLLGQRPPEIFSGGRWPDQILIHWTIGAWPVSLSDELGTVDSPAILRYDPIGGLGRALVKLDDQGGVTGVELSRDVVDEILVHPQLGQVANRS